LQVAKLERRRLALQHARRLSERLRRPAARLVH
jgi:hypothetical protein